MQTTAAVAIIYGLLVLAGGLMGYRKARSVPSLAAGLLFGILLVVSGFYLWHGVRGALNVAVVATAILLLVMGIRFVKTKKFMPAGLITVLSLVAGTIFALALMK